MVVTLEDVTLLSNLSMWLGGLVLLHPTVAHTRLTAGRSILIGIHSPQVKLILYMIYVGVRCVTMLILCHFYDVDQRNCEYYKWAGLL